MKAPIVDSLLDADTAIAIASAIRPVEITVRARDSMRERILRRVRRAAPLGTTTLRNEEGLWTKVIPGVRKKIVDDDPLTGTQTYFIEVSPGSEIPAHPHTLDEHCLVLEGEAWVNEHVLRRGDWHVAKAGSLHGVLSSRTGCLLLIRSECRSDP
jgi:quercetin dioxygenase-like cupin family protein